jgi:hypothetical protein
VRAILDNPRYTGFAFFGRWTRKEMLLDPDDVASPHVTGFRRAVPGRIRALASSGASGDRVGGGLHTGCAAPPIQSSRGTPDGAQDGAQWPANDSDLPVPGRIRCGECGRKMEASPRAHGMDYRCPARTPAPGSPALASHPPTVYLREDPLRDAVNSWIGHLFDPANVDRTVAALVASQEGRSVRRSPTPDRTASRTSTPASTCRSHLSQREGEGVSRVSGVGPLRMY